MSVLIVVAVKDRAMDAFSRPFFTPTVQAAVRSFSDEVNRAAPDNPMYAHPDDFDLYTLTSFDESSGLFAPESLPQLVVRGKDVKQSVA